MPQAHDIQAVGHHAPPEGFLRKYVFSKDHKVIGLQYYCTAMLMAVIAGLLAMLIAVARRQGVPLSKLRGTVQNDILKEYQARPPESSTSWHHPQP